MGTRSAAKIKLRNAPYKCDICGRRLMSAEALKSHQVCLHNLAVKVKTKSVPTKQAVIKPKNQLQSQKLKNEKLEKIVVKSKTALKKLPASNKSVNKTHVKSAGKASLKANPERESANCEYECPKCSKTFRIYFSAHRHIQKSHCVNSSGEKVSPNSPQLIKPITREICPKCNKRLDASETHVCEATVVENNEIDLVTNYMCIGCKQQFLNIRLFDLHVAGLHCNGVESMFFPNSDVFQTWKTEMEEQTKVKYSILGKYNFKKMYHCTLLPEGNSSFDDTTSYLCPSAIVVQQFSKGTQVHYYKDHYGHDCGTYATSDKYKKYSLNTLLKNAGAYTEQKEDLKVEENDLYVQFKQLMECIVVDAAKVNVETLKALIGKALDMTCVLNKCVDDLDSDSAATKRSIEKSITGALAQLEEKKKSEINNEKPQTEPITKRFKTRINQLNPNSDGSNTSSNVTSVPLQQDTSIKIINSFSLADQDISKVVNDLDSDESELALFEEMDRKEKESKMDNLSITKGEIEVTIKEERDSMDLSPSSFADSYKNFVDRNFKTEPEHLKRKIKTYGGAKSQLRKSSSPKPQTLTKESTKLSKSVKHSKVDGSSLQMKSRLSSESISNVPRAVDFKYEVKERENDCNILILKI